jgi:hypothetical protein
MAPFGHLRNNYNVLYVYIETITHEVICSVCCPTWVNTRMSTLYSDTSLYYTRKRERFGAFMWGSACVTEWDVSGAMWGWTYVTERGNGGVMWGCTNVTERGNGGVMWGCTYVTELGIGGVMWSCTYVTEPHESFASTQTLEPLTWVTCKQWQVLTGFSSTSEPHPPPPAPPRAPR